MADIQLVPSEKLEFVYQPKNAVFTQKLEPQARRFDTLTPNNKTQVADQYIYQQPKDYMNLRLLKRDVFDVSVTTSTVLPIVGVAGTSPAPLGDLNWFIDNLALSKMINGISIKWGSSSLESTRDDRNPWLLEVKSAQFPVEQAEQFGLAPTKFSGIGLLDEVISNGPIKPDQMLAYTCVSPPLTNQSLAANTKKAKEQRIMQNYRRVRIIGTPTFTCSAGTALTGSTVVTGFADIWVPTVTAGGATFYSGASPATVTGAYQIEIIEYIVDDFLTTPYQRNKKDKCIHISPSSFVTFNFSYDTTYISNGLFKCSTASSSPVVTCVRREADAQLVVESFDVVQPPAEGHNFKLFAFRPTKMEASVVALAANTESSDIVVNDQSSTVLPNFVLISADPELYNGNNSTFMSGLGTAHSFSTFFPTQITSCSIQIGQTTITENLPMVELQKMSEDLMNNPELAAWCSGLGDFVRFGVNQTKVKQRRGCPFLLLDIAKLSLLNSKDCVQQMPAVEYPVLQNMKITFKIKSQPIDATEGSVAAINYYPHVYKFYPYLYEQKPGEAMKRTQIYMSYLDAINRISRPIDAWERPAEALTMVGNGWFDDVKTFVAEHGHSIGKAIANAVRFGESISGDHPRINSALKTASEVAKYAGYGRRDRSGAIR